MPDLADLFPGFASRTVSTEGGRIFARVGGGGPPLVLVHGFPETAAQWHRIAPKLAERFTVVVRTCAATAGPRRRRAGAAGATPSAPWPGTWWR